MSDTPGFEWVGDASAPERAWFVHGILGQGRNWRSFAQRWRAGRDDRAAALVDLRNHGAHPSVSPPHDLAACARDVQAHVARAGAPTMLVGHSFGGKVVLRWLADHALANPPRIWILDSPPGAGRIATDDVSSAPNVLGFLATAPVPADSRDPVRQHLRDQGLPEPIVAWLLTSLQRSEDGQWRWLYDLDGISAMLDSYETTDLWPVVEAHPTVIRFVRAGRDGRFTADDEARARAIAGVAAHTLVNASHWLQVDDPEGLHALLDD